MNQSHQIPAPNEPCWCGSTRKYKQCHRPIDQAPPNEKYSEAQRIYATNWRVTARLQYERGDYHWMARKLQPYHVGRILDVGCGSGHGILAMLEVLDPGLRVVGLDENPSCLIATRDTVQQAGYPRASITNRVTTLSSGRVFRSTFEPIQEALHNPLALLQADVCFDPYIEGALKADGLFDAVTVWLSGVHMYRQQHAAVIDTGVDSDHSHRLLVQNSVYELANKVLRPGGVLQVVDRGEKLDSDLLKEDILQSHREQATPTSLQVREVDHTPSTIPEKKRVPMVLVPGTSGRTSTADMALISVISVKS